MQPVINILDIECKDLFSGFMPKDLLIAVESEFEYLIDLTSDSTFFYIFHLMSRKVC